MLFAVDGELWSYFLQPNVSLLFCYFLYHQLFVAYVTGTLGTKTEQRLKIYSIKKFYICLIKNIYSLSSIEYFFRKPSPPGVYSGNGSPSFCIFSCRHPTAFETDLVKSDVEIIFGLCEFDFRLKFPSFDFRSEIPSFSCREGR